MAWQPPPVFSPGESHGPRGLVSIGLQRVEHNSSSISYEKWKKEKESSQVLPASSDSVFFLILHKTLKRLIYKPSLHTSLYFLSFFSLPSFCPCLSLPFFFPSFLSLSTHCNINLSSSLYYWNSSKLTYYFQCQEIRLLPAPTPRVRGQGRGVFLDYCQTLPYSQNLDFIFKFSIFLLLLLIFTFYNKILDLSNLSPRIISHHKLDHIPLDKFIHMYDCHFYIS